MVTQNMLRTCGPCTGSATLSARYIADGYIAERLYFGIPRTNIIGGRDTAAWDDKLERKSCLSFQCFFNLRVKRGITS